MLDDMGEAFVDEQLWHRMRLRDKKDAYYIKLFLANMGIEIDGMSLGAAASSAVGYEVTAYVDHDPNKDNPELPYNRLKDFAVA